MRRRSDYPAYLGLRLLLSAMRPLPRPLSLAAGAALGRAARDLFGMRRDVADRNLAVAFPELDAAARRALARRSYAHFGRVAAESLLLAGGGPTAVPPLVGRFEGEELLRSAVALGRGIIMLTGHLGNWELAGSFVAALGLPVAAVVKPPSNRWVAGYLERSRRRAGMETIPMPEAVAAVPRALAAGKVVGLVADQGAIRSATWVPFFRRPTQTAVGPGLFAARTGAPVLFGGLIAEPRGRYRAFVEMLDDAPKGDAATLVVRIATLYRQRLEAAVRTAPEQYLWTHRLWGRQPPRSAPAPAAPAAR